MSNCLNIIEPTQSKLQSDHTDLISHLLMVSPSNMARRAIGT